MNEVITELEHRRSIRAFKPDMPRESDINLIAEAGLYAPSGNGRQSTKIIVVKNKKLRDEISKINCKIGGWKPDFDPFYGAPVIMIVIADKSVPTHIYDGALTMQNLMLAADSLGLGSIWIHRAREEFELDFGKDLLKKLNISGEWEGIGHCAVGYALGDYPSAAERKENRVYKIE